jgi:hypothetical protein
MSEPFGPFRAECDPVERVAQLRVLRTLVHGHLWTVDEGQSIEEALRAAEQDSSAVETAMYLFEMLPTLVKRRILTTFAYIHKPLYNRPREQPRKGTANASME